MENLEASEAITGYKVKIWERDAFKITGFTVVVPPGRKGAPVIPQFWTDVKTDGRLHELVKVSSVQPWILGLGSWDEECEKGGQRYTICLEETGQTDFTDLARQYRLHTQEFAATLWMCFETTEERFISRFWKDNPYKMMKMLGYEFNINVGVHFDAYPPGHAPGTNPQMEFWISVHQPRAI